MSMSITFYTLAEKQPKHGQEVVWMQPIGSFASCGHRMREIQAEWSWYDVKTDTSYCYSEDTEHEFSGDRWRLDILFDGNVGDNETLWCDVDEYFKAFEEK